MQCQLKRKPIYIIKNKLLLEREHKYDVCGALLDHLSQVDHITPLCEAVDESADEAANIRALCPQCHVDVTKQPQRPQHLWGCCSHRPQGDMLHAPRYTNKTYRKTPEARGPASRAGCDNNQQSNSKSKSKHGHVTIKAPRSEF